MSPVKSLEFYKGVTIVRIAGSITFDNLSQKMKDLLDVSKIAPLFNIYPSEGKAIKDLE